MIQTRIQLQIYLLVLIYKQYLRFLLDSLPKRKLEEITNLIYAEIDNAISSTSTYIRSLFDNKKRSIL